MDITHDILGRPELIQFDDSNVAGYNYIGSSYQVYRKYIYNGGGAVAGWFWDFTFSNDKPMQGAKDEIWECCDEIVLRTLWQHRTFRGKPRNAPTKEQLKYEKTGNRGTLGCWQEIRLDVKD